MKFISPPKSNTTRSFYNRLQNGEVKRGLWGAEARFDGNSIMSKVSVEQYFLPQLADNISETHSVLDIGCGPGGFLASAAPLCHSIIGCDITDSFIKSAEDLIHRHKISNAAALLYDGKTLPFADDTFDRVLMVDVLHHLDEPAIVINEARRVLTKDGLLLVFEPNKLNPLLSLMCLLDKNEWGLLRLGTVSAYRHQLASEFVITNWSFNGLLIGPDSRVSLAIVRFLNHPRFSRLFAWLNPKIFFCARPS